MLHITKNEDNLKIKHVICFFVSKDTPKTYDEIKNINKEDWTYQDWLTDACHNLNYNLIWFNKHYICSIIDTEKIQIHDSLQNTSVILYKSDKDNTIILQGQANDNPGVGYECLMRQLESFGFYMINTIDEIRIASDKLLSASILSANDINQPKYVLITKKLMENKDGNISQLFYKFLDSLYPNSDTLSNVTNEICNRKYVVKILGGSLGIGVFICSYSEIVPILQTIFALDPNRELIIQEFKENTGDIRAHAFSVDGGNYEIIASMKRNKIDKDFRSNVSLGATTDEIDLTPEQREIILKTAKISGCRWVGVDLMDCTDGSNVVIEYNSSPGVQGISLQINQNIFEIIFNKIDKYFEEVEKTKVTPKEYSKNITTYVQYLPDEIDKLKQIWGTVSDNRRKVLDECLSFIPGTQYKMHGKHSIEDGLDCSGFVQRVFSDSLDIHMPDMVYKYFSSELSNTLEKVDKTKLQPGDIGILSTKTKNNHIGIYAGDGKWFENSSVYGVQLTDYKWFKHFFTLSKYSDCLK